LDVIFIANALEVFEYMFYFHLISGVTNAEPKLILINDVPEILANAFIS